LFQFKLWALISPVTEAAHFPVLLGGDQRAQSNAQDACGTAVWM